MNNKWSDIRIFRISFVCKYCCLTNLDRNFITTGARSCRDRSFLYKINIIFFTCRCSETIWWICCLINKCCKLLVVIFSWSRISKPRCFEEMAFSDIKSHFWTRKMGIMILSHVIIMTGTWLIKTSAIFWSSHCCHKFFTCLWLWAIISWSCCSSTFLWVNKRS